MRFLESKDPAEADGEESAYQYCAGDPIKFIDPTGMVADYSGSGTQTTVNSAVHAASKTKNKRLKRIFRKKAMKAYRVEQAKRRAHERLVRARKAAERRRAAAQRRKAAAAARARATREAARIMPGLLSSASERDLDRMETAFFWGGMGVLALATVATGGAAFALVSAGALMTTGGLLISEEKYQKGLTSKNRRNVELVLGTVDLASGGCADGVSAAGKSRIGRQTFRRLGVSSRAVREVETGAQLVSSYANLVETTLDAGDARLEGGY